KLFSKFSRTSASSSDEALNERSGSTTVSAVTFAPRLLARASPSSMAWPESVEPSVGSSRWVYMDASSGRDEQGTPAERGTHWPGSTAGSAVRHRAGAGAVDAGQA